MFTPLRTMLAAPEGRVLVASAAATLAVGTVVYSVLEGWSIIDSLYFSVVTLATVGFGDLHPTTDIAKLFTVAYILTGLGILAAFASELTKVRQSVRTGSRIERVEAVVGHVEAVVEDEARHLTGSGGHDPRS
jgi:voltage-gated potassium channel